MPDGVPSSPRSSRREAVRRTHELEDSQRQRRVPVGATQQLQTQNTNCICPLRVAPLQYNEATYSRHLINGMPPMYVFFTLCILVAHRKHDIFRISAYSRRVLTLGVKNNAKSQYSQRLQQGPRSPLRTVPQANASDARGSAYREITKHRIYPPHKPRPPPLPPRKRVVRQTVLRVNVSDARGSVHEEMPKHPIHLRQSPHRPRPPAPPPRKRIARRTVPQVNVGDVRESAYSPILKHPIHPCQPLHKPRLLALFLCEQVTCRLRDGHTENHLTGTTSDGWTRSAQNVVLYTGSWSVQQFQEAVTLGRCFQCVVAMETYDFRPSPPHPHNSPIYLQR
jgi:hypothetical protein